MDILVVILVIIPLIVLLGSFIATRACNRNIIPDTSSKEIKKLSRVARDIIKEYNKLPLDNRPYANLTYMLKALDIKYGREEVNDHFSSRIEPNSRGFLCDCRRYSYNKRTFACKYSEYHSIVSAIFGVSKELESQKHALEVAAVQDGLSSIEDFTNRLREERNLISQVTKELT